jgi:hypothetical protein
MLVDVEQKRLAKLSGQIINRVEFGYGLFGHIDNGGTIEIGRVQVGLSEWKAALINIQLSGATFLLPNVGVPLEASFGSTLRGSQTVACSQLRQASGAIQELHID